MFICRGTLELPIQIKTNGDKEKLTIPTPTCVRSMLVQQPLNVQKEKKILIPISMLLFNQ